jgi:hypothetical protein
MIIKPINQMTLPEVCQRLNEHGFLAKEFEFIQLAARIFELTRWIPVSERLPTNDDLDENGEVLAYSPDPAITVNSTGIPFSRHFTHWKQIIPPEDK